MFHVVLIFPRKSAKTAHRCAVHTVPRAETGGICLAVGWSDLVLFWYFRKAAHCCLSVIYLYKFSSKNFRHARVASNEHARRTRGAHAWQSFLFINHRDLKNEFFFFKFANVFLSPQEQGSERKFEITFLKWANLFLIWSKEKLFFMSFSSVFTVQASINFLFYFCWV